VVTPAITEEPVVRKEELKPPVEELTRPVTPEVEIPEKDKPVSAETTDLIEYRVQLMSAVKPRRNLKISIDGERYTATEYLYKGEYRYTIGSFTDIRPAIELQYASRREGYPKAFVAVFRNNVRSLEPFEVVPPREEVSEPVAQTVPAEQPVITEQVKADTTVAEKVDKDVIEYRVQFLSSRVSRGTFTITVNGISYDVTEYFYKELYRYTIGSFDSILPAIELQHATRRSGYPDAFVVVFKNNERTLDRELFIREKAGIP